MTLSTRIARLTARARSLPVFGLVADPWPKRLYERRRWQCRNLAQCEAAWLERHLDGNNAAGACPVKCGGFDA